MASKKTHTQWILEQLKRGQVTAIDALEGCGCFRLAARINDLRRAGVSDRVREAAAAERKTVAEYSLIGKFSEGEQ